MKAEINHKIGSTSIYTLLIYTSLSPGGAVERSLDPPTIEDHDWLGLKLINSTKYTGRRKSRERW